MDAFSDGVFAIAITLLVLEIRPPEEGDLLHGLAHLWPKYFSFVLSFATILIMWVNHHGLFRNVRRVDAHVMFTNGLLLLFITFVPFPTAVLGDYMTVRGTEADARVAAAFYALTFVCINIAWAVMWHSIQHRRHAVAPGIDDHQAKTISRSLVVGFAAYSSAMVLAAVNAVASVVLCMLIAVFWTYQAFRYHPEAAHA
jgi:uncharacterized membrane protein